MLTSEYCDEQAFSIAVSTSRITGTASR